MRRELGAQKEVKMIDLGMVDDAHYQFELKLDRENAIKNRKVETIRETHFYSECRLSGGF